MKWTLLALSFVVSTTGLAQSLADRMQAESESVSLAADFCHFKIMGPGQKVVTGLKNDLSRADCYVQAREALSKAKPLYNKVMVEHSGNLEVFFREDKK